MCVEVDCAWRKGQDTLIGTGVVTRRLVMESDLEYDSFAELLNVPWRTPMFDKMVFRLVIGIPPAHPADRRF